MNTVEGFDSPDAITKRGTLEREIASLRQRRNGVKATYDNSLRQLETVERSHEVNTRNLRDVEYLLQLAEAEIVKLGGAVPPEPQPILAQNVDQDALIRMLRDQAEIGRWNEQLARQQTWTSSNTSAAQQGTLSRGLLGNTYSGA